MKKSRLLTLEMYVIILDKQIKVFSLSIEQIRRTSIIFSFKVRQKSKSFWKKSLLESGGNYHQNNYMYVIYKYHFKTNEYSNKDSQFG